MITKEEALEALNSLDDFAKMDTSIDPIGPRGVLQGLIEQAFSEGGETHRPPTKEELAAAVDQYMDNDIQIDDNALVAPIEDSENVWVSAWLYVRMQ